MAVESALAGRPRIFFRYVPNYYDHQAGDWVTDQTRYERVLAEPRFAPIREYEVLAWRSERALALILELLAAVPDDAISFVGSGPLEDFVRQRGADCIDQLEAHLAADERLRDAALNMYLTQGELPPPIESRLSAAIGPKFWFLDDPPANER